MERLNEVLARLVAVRPQMFPTRSALIRELLTRGLDDIEPDLSGEEVRARRCKPAGTSSFVGPAHRQDRPLGANKINRIRDLSE